MTKSEQQAALARLRDEAKDYQAELGFLSVRQTQDAKRVEALTAILVEGERKYATISNTPVQPDPEAQEPTNA